MSQTVDAHLLLYASDETSPFHARAVTFLEQLARGRSLVYLFWPTVMAYLRIATHSSVFAQPLTPAAAIANIEALLTLPNVQTTGEQERFWQVYRDAAETAAVTGNHVPDAHLVALMRENGVRTIWTNDRDFRRFDGIAVRDPFA
jgi:toxin-antitoxin system PIN domain toxin